MTSAVLGAIMAISMLTACDSDESTRSDKEITTTSSKTTTERTTDSITTTTTTETTNSEEPPAPAPVEESNNQMQGFIAPAPAPTPVPATAPAPAATYFANCGEARAAGAAPLYAGNPGYSRKLDRDGDGIACE
ncbi:excalibur calcium-binding domain-containing protein [Corynebacterium sp. CCM 9203]|uniref:excalibur calcium-binding domain-containing protein n=1 Tax=Corynebacterium sp. CCM 9203 TaxID=3057615 RepID=UPI0035239BAC